MVTVREVKTRRDRREFLDFPLRLYRENPYFVPPLMADEKKIFSSRYEYYSTCEAVYFLAEKDGVTAGRISGILQKVSNEIRNEKRIRFTRFDSIDDREVSAALFGAVEAWGRDRGMDTIVGPLGFSDLEREGLLIEGFDQPSTFEEQYNAPYYAELVENSGFVKEIDWTESQLRAPSEEEFRKVRKLADSVMERNRLHYAKAKSVGQFLDRYMEDLFTLIDKSYVNIYGSVPFNDDTKRMLKDNFRLVLRLDYIALLLDQDEKPVCFGICFPSVADVMKRSEGRLTPMTLLRFLKATRDPSVIDLCLVGVDPEYTNRGISAVIMAELMRMLSDPKIDHAETNLNLEDNLVIQNMWKRFDRYENKRRRSYVKKIMPE